MVVGIEQVERQLATFATPVQGQRRQHIALALIVDGSVAVAVHAVEAHAKLVALTEAPANVDMAAKLGIGSVGGGQPGQRRVASALGNQVDNTAHRTAGRHAVKQRRRAFEYFDAFVHFG
ncbi:hypothetical protein D3C81_1271950 [compost metagenome]